MVRSPDGAFATSGDLPKGHLSPGCRCAQSGLHTVQQLQKYDKGVNRVSAGRLATIADFLGAPVTFFYDGLGERTRQADPRIAFAFLASKRALRLLRAYSQIAPPGAKAALVTLAEALRGRDEE